MGDCQERKETRFNLLMGVSFELLTIGQLLGALKYFVLASLLFDNTGDIMRIPGLFLLLTAVLRE